MVARSLLNWLKFNAKRTRRPQAARLNFETLEDRRTPTAMFSIGDITVDEGDAGTLNALVPVTLTGSHGNGVTVDYKTLNDSAVAGSDFIAVTGKLTFAKNESTKSIVIPIRGDRAVESYESFSVLLSNAKAAKIVDGTSYVAIYDNEPYAHISTTPFVTEGIGTADFGVYLTSEYDLPVTIDFTTVDGTAVAGSDFVAATSSLLFLPGETSKTISIATIGDHIGEPIEYFSISLSTQNSYASVGSTIVGATIYDDEPQLSITDAYLSGTTFTFTVTISGNHDAVSVDFTTANVTAVAGVDYITNFGTLHFADNEYSKTIIVEVIDPAAYDKYFTIELSNISSSVYVANPTAYGYWYYDSGYGGGDYYWDYYYYGWY